MPALTSRRAQLVKVTLDRTAPLLCALVLCVWSAALLAGPAASDPLLWRVQSPGQQAPVYLFGSLHFGDDSFYPLPDTVLDAYHASDVLAVELDVSGVAPQKMRATLDRLGRYPSGIQLSERIGPALWSELTQASQRLGVQTESIVQLRPWLAALQLVNLQVARTDYQAGRGIDRHFMEMAAGVKPVEPLETLEQQLDLFAGMSEGEQSAFLEHTLADLEATGPQLHRMARAWREGDREDLEEVILGAFDSQEPFSQTLYHRVFRSRNQAMVEAVRAYLADQRRVFLVVGVGHLIGPDGLVDGLREAGYSVERL